MLVEQPEGHQEQTAAGTDRPAQAAVDVELLDLELPYVARRGHRVLEFVLGVEFRALIKGVPEAEHRARQIGPWLVSIARGIGVVHLAVTPQAQACRERRSGDPRGRRRCWQGG